MVVGVYDSLELAMQNINFSASNGLQYVFSQKYPLVVKVNFFKSEALVIIFCICAKLVFNFSVAYLIIFYSVLANGYHKELF